MKYNIKKSLISLTPFRFKKYIFKYKLYLREPKLFFLSKQIYTSTSPTLLLLSFPRSGSSWVGSILGTGTEVRYLREPITTSYTIQEPHRISVFEKNICDNWTEYNKYIDKSFNGSVDFSSSIIKSPEQWLSPKDPKTLIIKEVNPLIIDSYLSKSINLIYLLRHPFSVARSYDALKWQPKEVFTNKFDQCTLNTLIQITPNLLEQSFWFQMGYLQGWVEATVKKEVNETKSKTHNVTVVRYEDICRHTKNKFMELFKFANIPFTEKVNTAIAKSQKIKKQVSAGDFTLTRNKKDIETIKIKAGEQANYHELMFAYNQAISDFCKSQELTKNNIAPSFTINSSLVKLL
jgi:hypothetical protein